MLMIGLHSALMVVSLSCALWCHRQGLSKFAIRLNLLAAASNAVMVAVKLGC